MPFAGQAQPFGAGPGGGVGVAVAVGVGVTAAGVPATVAGRRVMVVLLDEEDDEVVVDVATAAVEFERLSKRIA